MTEAGPVMSLTLERGGEWSQMTEGKAKWAEGMALIAKAPGVRGDMSLCSTLRRAKAWSPWETWETQETIVGRRPGQELALPLDGLGLGGPCAGSH